MLTSAEPGLFKGENEELLPAWFFFMVHDGKKHEYHAATSSIHVCVSALLGRANLFTCSDPSNQDKLSQPPADLFTALICQLLDSLEPFVESETRAAVHVKWIKVASSESLLKLMSAANLFHLKDFTHLRKTSTDNKFFWINFPCFSLLPTIN